MRHPELLTSLVPRIDPLLYRRVRLPLHLASFSPPRCSPLSRHSSSLLGPGYDIAEFTDYLLRGEAEALVAHPLSRLLCYSIVLPTPCLPSPRMHRLSFLWCGSICLSASPCGSPSAGANLGIPPAKRGPVYCHPGLRRFVETVGLPRTRYSSFTGHNLLS